MKKILFCVFMFITISYAQDFYALCVGVGIYGNEVPSTNSDDCASAFRLELINDAFWPSSHVKKLTNYDAQKEDIIDKIEVLPKNSSTHDILYYSAHGSTTGVATYYFLDKITQVILQLLLVQILIHMLVLLMLVILEYFLEI